MKRKKTSFSIEGSRYLCGKRWIHRSRWCTGGTLSQGTRYEYKLWWPEAHGIGHVSWVASASTYHCFHTLFTAFMYVGYGGWAVQLLEEASPAWRCLALRSSSSRWVWFRTSTSTSIYCLYEANGGSSPSIFAWWSPSSAYSGFGYWALWLAGRIDLPTTYARPYG
jgi:hypothetical protein